MRNFIFSTVTFGDLGLNQHWLVVTK